MTEKPPYPSDGIHVLVDTANARVIEVTLGPGQSVPTHKHTHAEELCYCLTGSLSVESQGHPRQTLKPGESCRIPGDQVHQVINPGPAPCKLLLVHRGGGFDFIPSDA